MSRKFADFVAHVDELMEKGLSTSKIQRHDDFKELEEATAFLNEHFETVTRMQRYWHAKNQLWDFATCKMCDEHVTWRRLLRSYSTYCSSKCAHSDPVLLERTEQTNLERYGERHVVNVPELREQAKQTKLERYGHENGFWAHRTPDQVSEEYRKARNKNLDRVGEIEEMIEAGLTQHKIGEQLGLSQPRVHHLLRALELRTSTTGVPSVLEQEIVEFVETLNVNFVRNDRTLIGPKELDLYIPEHKIAIEINGTYWHSELAGRDKWYHLNKTQECKKVGVQLIHVSDADWIYKREIVKSRIQSAVNRNTVVYARKCQIVELSSTEVSEFLTNHHLQGDCPSKFRYGLTHLDELVAVMTFGASRYSKHAEYELLRYASKCGTNVVGGASKLLKAFEVQLGHPSIISYCNLKWGNGGMYRHLGFEYDGTSSPGYSYFDRDGNTTVLMSRQQFQKHKLPTILENFDPELSEWDNMIEHGYDRIWDCGNSRWLRNKKGA